MAAIAIAVSPSARSTGGADLDHYSCCDENRALCGVDLTGQPDTDAPCGLDCPFGNA